MARDVADLGGAELMRHYGRLSSIENKVESEIFGHQCRDLAAEA